MCEVQNIMYIYRSNTGIQKSDINNETSYIIRA